MRTIAIKLNRRDHRIQVASVRNNIRLGVIRRKITLKHSGLRGPQGPGGTVTVGGTYSLNPGTPAEVTNIGTLEQAILEFYIPKGDKGDKGDTGVSTFVRVHHGSNPNMLRPNAFFVEWVGTVPPLNGSTEDTWIDTA
jgi:hypothetical protein